MAYNAERLIYLKNLRIKLRAALDASVEKSGTQSYTLEDSDGKQSLTRRSPKELMDMLKTTDNEIADLERAARGGGIRTFGTRLRP
jgi:hypothetical protein